jgi:hypothetical protein
VSKFLKYPSFFRKRKEKKKICKDLGFDQHLTKFAKITMHESLKFFIIFFYKKKKEKKKDMGILRILTRFNKKS